jgi:hypothetical protein
MVTVATVRKTHNGMNLSRSMSNPNSNSNRILRYLKVNGPSTRREIIYNVFGIVLSREHWTTFKNRPNVRAHAWGANPFILLQTHGYMRRTGSGNHYVYEAL